MNPAQLKEKILVADDSPGGRELVRTILEQGGYQVLEASNGAEALESAREFHPDLIILDLHMPQLDGFGVIRQLRSEEGFAATPVMALTASAMRGDRERAMEAGFTGYLTKPIRPSALRVEVERLLK
jgi:CheY-like chemotaxis protein